MEGGERDEHCSLYHYQHVDVRDTSGTFSLFRGRHADRAAESVHYRRRTVTHIGIPRTRTKFPMYRTVVEHKMFTILYFSIFP